MGFLDFLGAGKAGGAAVGGALSGVGDLAKDIRSAITGELSPESKADIEAKTLELQARIVEAQTAVNRAEAQHKSIFVAGWRPFIGWVCGFAFAWQFVAAPIATWAVEVAGGTAMVTPLDVGPLLTLALGMLGMAGLRTVEKRNGTQSNH